MATTPAKPEFSPWASPKALDSVAEGTQVQKAKKSQADLDGLWTIWKANPGPDTVAPVLDALDSTINSGLTSFARGSVDSMRTRAKLLAVKAMESYNPKMSARLNTHVYNSLQKLYRERADRENVVHVPENVALEKNRLAAAATDFQDKNGREPSVLELADATGLSVKRLEKLSKYKNNAFESQFLSERGDTLYASSKDPHQIWIDYVYTDMDPIDRKIFEWSTGYAGTERIPKKDIADRLRISAPAVSARINKIISKIQEGYSLGYGPAK